METAKPRFLNFSIQSLEIINISSSGEVLKSHGTDTSLNRLICQGLGVDCMLYHQDHYRKVDLMPSFQLVHQLYKYSSDPYGVLCFTFVTRHPDYAKKTFQFIHVFTLSMWMSILLAMISVSVFHYFLFGRRVSLLISFFYVWNTFCAKFHEWKPKSSSQRFLLISWNIGIAFISLSYVLNLFIMMTAPIKKTGIKDFNDLYHHLREEKAKVKEFDETNIVKAFMNSEDEKLKFIAEILNGSSKLHSFESAFEFLSENNHVLLCISPVAENILSRNYFVSNECILPSWYVFVIIRKSFCCKDKMNKVISRMWPAGLYNQIVNRGAHRSKAKLQKKFTYREKEPVQPLTLEDLSGPFFVLIFGHILGLTSFFIEHCASRLLA